MTRSGLGRLLVCLCTGLGCAAAFALVPKTANGPLDQKEFFKPDLHISTSNVAFADVQANLPNRAAWNRFFAAYGQDFRVWVDPRSGAPTNLQGHIAFLPGNGVGNRVTMADVERLLGRKAGAVDENVVADLLRGFLFRNSDAFSIDATQLGPIRADRVRDDYWQISIPQVVNGIPVRYGRMLATISHGNLIVVGADTWGNVSIETTPRIAAEDAIMAGYDYAGGAKFGDTLWMKPQLEIIPYAPAEHTTGESFDGPVGAGYGHRLAWTFGFTRDGETGTWRVSVDARTGEVLEFKDVNHYAKEKISGGIYPVTSTDICPDAARCGTMQPGSPMPWANTGQAAPNDFTNSAGVFESSGAVSTSLVGKYVRITDNCGAINETAASGSLDLGGTNGQHDCTTSGSSAGDTPSARSAFYEVNKLAEIARGWLPGNTWLQSQIPTNVNINSTCNAYYSPSAGSINFYKSGGGCRNTGEIAAVFDHEWGHALDDNDTGGTLSTTSESYADIAAVYRLQMSCVGYGFWWTSDQGCGMTADGTGYNGDNGQISPACELNCSGVRGVDWAGHAGTTPDTPANFSCVKCDSGGSGPCGREVHCDAMPASEAAWDFAARDLQAAPFNYDAQTAFIVANKIFYQGSGNVGSWHSCSCPSTSDGCGATNAYTQWLTADDDNGNLNDGTPHMTALYAAFNRHGIACATPAPVNSGCSGGPTVAPTLTASAGSNQVVLNWNTVSGATKYWVFRSEGFAGCEFSKALIATVTGTTYTDNDTANGRLYSYNVGAVGGSDACFTAASTCVQAAPQPCAGSIALDKSVYNCNDSIQISLVDSDLTGAGTQTVTVVSTTETSPETVVLTESPAASGQFSGTIATTGGAPVSGDGAISVGTGDTITVTYVDASYCGTPNQDVTQSVPADCSAPTISSVFANNVTGSQAAINWTTDEAANSLVHYGRTLPPGSLNTDPTFVTTHTRPLNQLFECSTYYYSVESADPAGNAALDDNGGNYYTFVTGKNVNPSYPSLDTPVAIPDNTPSGAQSVINVVETNQVLDVNVTVNIAHTYDGDIALYLIGPNGTQVTLSNKHGGGSDNYTNTTFDDQATTPIASGSAPFTGSFIPDSPLSVFNGITGNGAWTLKVVDSAGSDVGTITNWTLTLLYPAEDCGATLRLDADKYSCSSTIGIKVKDTTLTGTPSLTVTVQSNTESTPETVVLLAQPAPQEDTFIGSIPATAGPASHGDGLLSASDADTITVTYIDADDGQGGTNIVKTDTALADCGKPVITNVGSSDVGSTTAKIAWTTNENANSVVRYGTSAPPASTTTDPALATAHNVGLAGLAECTTYLYSVESTDDVGNTGVDTNSGNYRTFTTGRASNVSYTSTDTPKAIPDNSTAGATSSVTVSENSIVQDVNVTVNITHTFDGDLTLTLIAPNGTSVALSNKRGSSGDNFTNTVFDDAAATAIANGAAPFTGSFRPDSPLSVLNGIASAGVWQLKVVDNASSDSGNIVNWTLHLGLPPGSCGASASYASNTRTDSCPAGGAGSGNGVTDRGEDIALSVSLRNSGTVPLTNVSAVIASTTPGVFVTRSTGSFPNLAVGATAPSNAPDFAYTVTPAVPCGATLSFAVTITTDEGVFTDTFTTPVGAPGSATNTYPAADVPKPLPDSATTLSTIAVTDTGAVQDVNVNLTLTHTYDGDLSITLIGPNGTRVLLSNRRGSSGDNFTNTTFDDAATTAIASGTAPFTGSFKPDAPLSALNGIAANGNWQLEVKDNASGDSGTLQSWNITVQTSAGIVCNDCALAVPSAETVGQVFMNKTTQQWQSVAGAAFYNVYRGTSADLPALVTPAVDSCLRLTTTTTTTGSVLTEQPAAGSAYWYLVRAANGAGDGPAGNATTGPRSHQSGSACP